jgi:hypothetical protein
MMGLVQPFVDSRDMKPSVDPVDAVVGEEQEPGMG